MDFARPGSFGEPERARSCRKDPNRGGNFHHGFIVSGLHALPHAGEL